MMKIRMSRVAEGECLQSEGQFGVFAWWWLALAGVAELGFVVVGFFWEEGAIVRRRWRMLVKR